MFTYGRPIVLWIKVCKNKADFSSRAYNVCLTVYSLIFAQIRRHSQNRKCMHCRQRKTEPRPYGSLVCTVNSLKSGHMILLNARYASGKETRGPQYFGPLPGAKKLKKTIIVASSNNSRSVYSTNRYGETATADWRSAYYRM